MSDKEIIERLIVIYQDAIKTVSYQKYSTPVKDAINKCWSFGVEKGVCRAAAVNKLGDVYGKEPFYNTAPGSGGFWCVQPIHCNDTLQVVHFLEFRLNKLKEILNGYNNI